MKSLITAAMFAVLPLASGSAIAQNTQELATSLKLTLSNLIDPTAYMTSAATYSYYYPFAAVGQPNGYIGSVLSHQIFYNANGQFPISITPTPAFGSLIYVYRLDGLALYWSGHECVMSEPFDQYGSFCVFNPRMHDITGLKSYCAILEYLGNGQYQAIIEAL